MESESLVLLQGSVNLEELASRQIAGELRAVMGGAMGVHVAAYTTMSTAMVNSFSCPEGVNCDPYRLLPILNKVSYGLPQAVMITAALTIEHGQRRSFALNVLQVGREEEESGIFLAAAHLFGRGQFNAYVEVLADSQDVALDVLLRVTDVPGVADVAFTPLDPETCVGMGSEYPAR